MTDEFRRRVLVLQQPQRQDALLEQLRDVAWVADILGMYDAADAVRSLVGNVGGEQRRCTGCGHRPTYDETGYCNANPPPGTAGYY